VFESSDGVPGWVDTDTLLRAEPCEPCGPHAGFAGGGSIFVLTECAFSLERTVPCPALVRGPVFDLAGLLKCSLALGVRGLKLEPFGVTPLGDPGLFAACSGFSPLAIFPLADLGGDIILLGVEPIGSEVGGWGLAPLCAGVLGWVVSKFEGLLGVGVRGADTFFEFPLVDPGGLLLMGESLRRPFGVRINSGVCLPAALTELSVPLPTERPPSAELELLWFDHVLDIFDETDPTELCFELF